MSKLIYNERTRNKAIVEHIVKCLRKFKAPNLKPRIELVHYPSSQNYYINVYVADVNIYEQPYWSEYRELYKLLKIANELLYGRRR